MQVEFMQPVPASEGDLSNRLSTLRLNTEASAMLPWYVTYTRSRHEKHVARQLEERGISFFLPLYKSMRRWKDRKKQVELPLFPNYIFVQMKSERRMDLLRIPGVVHLVTFHGKPAPAASAEIETLRRGLMGSSVVRPHPYLIAGRKVRIRKGSLAGIEGIFVRKKDRARVVLSISLIERSVAMEIDEADVEPIS
jgi:transcription elongation factor/antiterminator RfaH